MCLSTYYLDHGRHVARLRRRRRRRAYAPTSSAASHDNHEKINSWVSFAFLYVFEYGAPLGGPSGRRSSAIIINFHEDNIEENMINMQKLKQGEHTVFPAVLCARAEKSGSSRRLQKLTLSGKPV